MAAIAAATLLYFVFPAQAEELTFEAMLSRALEHSLERKIAKTDVDISAFRRDEVFSLYYPIFTVRFYNEYVKVLEDEAEDVVAVGDIVSAAPQSTYQHLAVAGLNYRLYDFGARGLKVQNAEREIRISRFNAGQLDLDLRREVLDTYTRGLIHSRQIALNREIMDRRKEIFRHTRKLQEAGTMDRYQVEHAGLKFAEAASMEDYYRAELQQVLGRIGYLTGENYPLETTTFADLEAPALERLSTPDVNMLPGVRAVDEEITSKEKEYDINRREMLPRLAMQSTYRWFGSNEDSFSESFRNLSERDATIGVVAEWEFFSGFRDIARGRRLKEEIKRLRLKKEKRVAEFQQDVITLRETCRLFAEARERGEARLSHIIHGRNTLNRLSDQQMLGRLSVLEREIELIEHEMDAYLKRIEQAVAAYKLKFYSQYGH
jgi:outer membrane protein TolC